MPSVVALDYAALPLKIIVQTPIEQQFRAFACTKEPWTVAFLETMGRGDVLWDVGANVGSYTLIAAARGNQVVAVEPGHANFQALLGNLGQNTLKERVLALNVALGATTERIDFAQQASPGYGEGGGLALNIQQTTLDDLLIGGGTAVLLPWPTHIKIDVDGHELAVLAGAERVLRGSRCRALLIEVKRDLGERVSDLMALWGWTRTALFEERNGQMIPGIRYEQFEKTRVEAEDGPVTGAGEPSSAIPLEALAA